MEGQIYSQLRTLLKTQVPALKFIDIYRRQFEPNADGNFDALPAHRPCALIEFGERQSSTAGRKVEQYVLPFNVYIVTDTIKEWSAEQDDTLVEDEITSHTDIVIAAKAKLINFRGGQNGSLFNSGIVTRPGGKYLQIWGPHIVSVVALQCMAIDNSATNTNTVAPAAINTTVEISVPTP